MIKRIAAALGAIVFLVVAGTSLSYAYWADSAGVTTTVAAANPAVTNCANIVRIGNGNFEAPVLANNWGEATNAQAAPWVSVNRDTGAQINLEYWRDDFQAGFGAVSGTQFIELNSTAPANLYQNIATTPGTTMHWGFWHRGRNSATTADQLRLTIGPTTGSMTTGGTIYSTTSVAWVYYSGSYTVPAGQTTTRFALSSVTSGSIGNFLDDVSFGTGACINRTSTISNVTTGGTTYRVGDTVQYTTTVSNAGGTAAGNAVAQITLPANLSYVPGSIVVNGTAATDASGDDVGNYAAGVVTARIGFGATATAGGSFSPDGTATVTYRAVIGVGAASGTITHAPVVTFVDPAVPTWTLTATGATLTTNVAAASDLAVAVLAQPTITGGASATWTFRVTNNGPSAATGASVALALTTGPTYGSVTMTTSNAGPGTTNCTGTGTSRTCAIGAIPAGEGRTISVTATLPANPTSLYPITATVTSTSYDHASGNNAATNTGIDGIAPTAPTALAASRASNTTIGLTWNAATDTLGTVAGYRLYRNGTLVNPTTLITGTSYTDTVATNSLNWYWMVAVDAAGNVSPVSTGSGAAAYVTGTTNVRLVYPTGTNLCLGASGTNSGNDVEIRTGCTSTASSLVQWGFTAGATANQVQIQLTTGNTRRWANSTTGDINLTNNTNAWRLDVQWDSTNSVPYLRIANGANTGFCAAVNGTANGDNLQMTTCSTSAVTQRFALGAW